MMCASATPVMLRITALCVAAIAAGIAWCEDVLCKNKRGSFPYRSKTRTSDAAPVA